MVIRLRQNVIKTGLRKLNVSYSRISFEDIARKLHLESAQDAEFISAKVYYCFSLFLSFSQCLYQAIRDGVIDAVLDHENGYLQSKVAYALDRIYSKFIVFTL